MMEKDGNFVGDDILTQNVDLIINISDDENGDDGDEQKVNPKEKILESDISQISVHSDPFSYLNSNNRTILSSTSPPPRKRRKISLVVSDDDEPLNIESISDLFKRKGRKRKHRKMLVESQCFDDDDVVCNELEDDIFDIDEIHEINNNEKGAIKVLNLRLIGKKEQRKEDYP